MNYTLTLAAALLLLFSGWGLALRLAWLLRQSDGALAVEQADHERTRQARTEAWHAWQEAAATARQIRASAEASLAAHNEALAELAPEPVGVRQIITWPEEES